MLWKLDILNLLCVKGIKYKIQSFDIFSIIVESNSVCFQLRNSYYNRKISEQWQKQQNLEFKPFREIYGSTFGCRQTIFMALREKCLNYNADDSTFQAIL